MSAMTSTHKQANKSSTDKDRLIQGSNVLRTSTLKKPDPLEIIQRVRTNPDLITQTDAIYLQSLIGNRAVVKLLSDSKNKNVINKKENTEEPSALAAPKENKQVISDKPNNETSQDGAKVNHLSDDSKQETLNNSEPQKQEPVELKAETAKNQSTEASAVQENKAHGSESQLNVQSESATPVIENKVNDTVQGTETIPEIQEDGLNDSKKDKVADLDLQKDSVPTENSNQITSSEGNSQQTSDSVADLGSSPLMAHKEKAPSKPLTVSIKAEEPGGILGQLEDAPPAAIFDAYSQAVSASSEALNNQKQKTEDILPEVPAPTGLEPTQSAGKAGNALNPINHTIPQKFKSEKSGGGVYEGLPGEFNIGSQAEDDPEAIMVQARSYSGAAPQIGMTGEADPSQMEGFKAEATQSVQAAKQAELAQVSNDFGENNILPQLDNTTLKAQTTIQGVTPPAAEAMQTIKISQDIADRINQPLSSTLKSQIGAKREEYNKGKAKFDADVIAAKSDTDEQISQQKAEAREKQLNEQNKAKAEVEGLRGEWRSEIDGAVAEYDQKANAASQEKSRDIGEIKTQKEGEVQEELDKADTEAQKEYKAAKAEVDEKKKEGEKDDRSWFEKGLDWVKEKAQQAIDSIKKAVSFIFDNLKKAVKFIFDKAKEAAMKIIEAGRKLIVGLIKELGNFLKGLVKVVFARFPEIANKICSKIDQVVNKAIDAVNKAADLLKKGVTAALNLLAKSLDGLFGAIQSIYNGIISSIGKMLNGGFKEIFFKVLEAAQIAAEIAAAFATGGGSILAQIAIWLGKTLPELLRKVTAVLGFVDTIRNFKADDIKQFLNPMKVGEFLVKGLFGELSPLNQVEAGAEGKEESPKDGGKAKGLMKVFQILSGVFKMLKGVYNKVAGAINKVLPAINISSKPWFDMFSMIYAGAVKAMEVVKNPAEALTEGVQKLKEAVTTFFKGIKSKVVETASGIKEKVMLLGKPAQLMKLLANKAVDMVLNFIITHPPSALIKAAFKVIEAASGKSIIELVRQHIPFADKLINRIAESGPVAGLLKPLEGPVNRVGGMIDEVSGKAASMVDESEQKSVTLFGSGAKVLKEFAGNTLGNKNAPSSGGSKKGGGILGVVKSGIHTRLLALGQMLLQKGKSILNTSVNKIKGLFIGPKVDFKIGSENHHLWVEKRGSKAVVMMASEEDELMDKIEKISVDSEKVKTVNLLRGAIRDTELEAIKNSNSEGKKQAIEQKLNICKRLVTEIGSDIQGISKAGDDIPRISQIVVKFKRNPKHDATEFERQLKGQEKGLNSLFVYEFLQNRDRYIKEGRASEGNAAQKVAREKAYLDKVDELRENDLSRKEAEKQASEWIKGQAALHNPDQIAGGNPLDITGIGDTRINSSIGSQWKNKIGEFDKKVRDVAAKMTEKERKSTKLNVKLSY